MKEMELELEARFAQAKARMLGDMVQASALADVTHGTAADSERSNCPHCGGGMISKGKRKRRLTSQHDQTVELERSYLECTVCGFKHFPPG
jgi:tRNA(Ile2) C34 agmatinyltransferase TiaS